MFLIFSRRGLAFESRGVLFGSSSPGADFSHLRTTFHTHPTVSEADGRRLSF